MIRNFLYSACTIAALGSFASAEEIQLESCVDNVPSITDMSFITPEHAILATQEGQLYWFQGCHKPALEIGTIPDVSTRSWTLGLYSVAARWDFFLTHQLYAYYTVEEDGQLLTRLANITVGHQGVSEVKTVLDIPQPFERNNGGALRFGPDGALYLGIGDGGSEGDPLGNAQNVTTLTGSLLRFYPSLFHDDVYLSPSDNLRKFMPEAAPEILAYGVRNPWKMTFDHQGDVILADVGEHTLEEINIIRADMIGHQPMNLGWPIKEGKECFDPQTNITDPDATCTVENEVEPIYQYRHSGDTGNSITGGETLLLNGKEYYLFADYMTGEISALDLNAPETPVAHYQDADKHWATFGKSMSGDVYVADHSGTTLYRVSLQP